MGVGSLILQQVTPRVAARHEYDRADRPAAAYPRRSSQVWPGQQAAAALARRLFAENEDRVVVADVVEPGPAVAAGLRRGDIISAVGDLSVETLGDFYQVWSCGPAGVEIPIEVVRDRRSFWPRLTNRPIATAFSKSRACIEAGGVSIAARRGPQDGCSEWNRFRGFVQRPRPR